MCRPPYCWVLLVVLLVVSLPMWPETAYCNRRLKVRLTDQRMVIVPVRINGQGPYDFLLDTGSTTTVIKPELISKLQGKAIGVGGYLAGVQKYRVTWYRFNSLGFEGVEIGPVGVIGLPADSHASIDADGILGQDILHFYNYLLDYRKKVIEVDEDNSLAASLSSSALPLVETEERLVVAAVPKSKSKKRPLFILDSGADCLVLFKRDYPDYGLDIRFQPIRVIQTADGDALLKPGVVRSLRIGHREITNVAAIFAPITSYTASRPELGAVPLTWFCSVYINHTSKFVALDPKFRSSKVTQARLK